jgi:hypothetical protein
MYVPRHAFGSYNLFSALFSQNLLITNLGAYQAPWYVLATILNNTNAIVYQTYMPVINGSATFTLLGFLRQASSLSVQFSLQPNLNA